MRFKVISLVLTLAAFCSAGLASQGGPAQAGGQPSVEEIIRRFAAAESENKVARNNYTFTQDFDLLTLGEAGSITGRFHRVSDIVYDDMGNRIEKITFFPASTLTELSITNEDMADLAGVQPFALTTEDIPKYQINFLAKEKIDELNTYTFDVKPKQIKKGERYFEGRIWVDDHDLQIVKVAGKAVPEVGDQKFPHFETYRENIDGRYWFPTYVYADDVLDFRKGPSVHLRMTVRYTNYKKFGGRIRLADEGEPASEEDLKAAEKNKSAQQPGGKPSEPAKPELKKKPPTD
jgi:hypothetical protein